MATRGRGDAASDDEFLQNLYRGGELLAAGKVIEAKDYLERAFKLQPKNEKGQNLLGLTYFKLGLFDRAAEIYEALVRENPVDATLRVNLGLVYLKTSQLQRAIREFETSVDLAPEHKKAHNYLGLALAQLGNYAVAKAHFIEAGSDAMAQKMERALAGEAAGLNRMPAPAEQPQRGFEVELQEESAPPDEFEAPNEPQEDWGAHFGAGEPDTGTTTETVLTPEELAPPAIPPIEEGPAPVGTFGAEPAAVAVAPVMPPPAAPAEEWTAAPLSEVAGRQAPAPEARAVAGRPLAELAPTLEILKRPVTAPFEVRDEGVAISVQGELLTRVEGLLLTSGAVRFDPELKRFRGRTTDQPFGEGAARMMRASGKAVLVVAAGEQQRFEAVDLAEESAYFREETVFAFEEPVTFENGRIPSEVTGDLDLVHLRGKGKVLLRLGGALRAHQVRMEESAVVPLERLVGWFGNVTPRLLAVAQDESGQVVKGGVELSGEGFVLFSAQVQD